MESNLWNQYAVTNFRLILLDHITKWPWKDYAKSWNRMILLHVCTFVLQNINISLETLFVFYWFWTYYWQVFSDFINVWLSHSHHNSVSVHQKVKNEKCIEARKQILHRCTSLWTYGCFLSLNGWSTIYTEKKLHKKNETSGDKTSTEELKMEWLTRMREK